MIKIHKKALGTSILVEKDGGTFIVSIPGIMGAHADGATLERALKNLDEVVSLLKEYHGEKKFLNLVKKDSQFFGVLPYTLEYA